MQTQSEIHDSVYVIVWEFHVRLGLEQRFERAYGPEGEWAQLFHRDPNYLGTELLREVSTKGRFLTLDVWLSEAAYEAFRHRHRDEYKKLDESFEALTERETRLGAFHTVGRSSLLALLK